MLGTHQRLTWINHFAGTVIVMFHGDFIDANISEIVKHIVECDACFIWSCTFICDIAPSGDLFNDTKNISDYKLTR